MFDFDIKNASQSFRTFVVSTAKLFLLVQLNVTADYFIPCSIVLSFY